MKVAQHPDTHQPLPAAAEAPAQALCPYCGGHVTLRRRKQMKGNFGYFWRHLDHHSRHCQGRSRPDSLRR